MELTDEKVRQYFNEKREKLEKKLAVHEHEINQTKSQLVAIEAALLAIGVDFKNYPEISAIETSGKISEQNEIKYDANWKAWDKFLFALKHLGKATAQEAAEFIYQHDNNTPIISLRLRFKDLGSIKYSTNEIDVDKSEKLYKYSLRKKKG